MHSLATAVTVAILFGNSVLDDKHNKDNIKIYDHCFLAIAIGVSCLS